MRYGSASATDRFRLTMVSILATIAATVLPGSSSSPARAATPPSGTAPARLEVLVAGPRGAQENLFSIDCAFSEPMVRLGERGRDAKKGPLLFDPPLRGTYSWIGTSTVCFLPAQMPPAGTRITCTIPEGLKSLAGRTLETAYSWTIDYRRPRLISSIPAIPPAKRRNPPPAKLSPSLYPDDPLLLAFSAPLRSGEAERIRVRGPEGEVALRVVRADSIQLRALFPGAVPNDFEPAGLVALQPLRPLGEGIVYSCEVPGDLGFADRTLGLPAAIAWDFLTTPPPGVLSVRAEDGQLAFVLASPTEPESLLAHLQILPPAGSLRADGWNERVSVWGGLPAGKLLRIEVTPGLPDLFGRRTAKAFSAFVEMPHAEARLSLYPEDGVLLPDSGQFVQVKAQNVEAVRLRAAWLSSEETGRYLGAQAARSRAGDEGDPSPGSTVEAAPRWIELPSWKGPFEHPDSLLTLEYRFDRLRPRPPRAAGLLFSVEGDRLFPGEQEGQADPLKQVNLVRITRVGIHCQLGETAGLLWITDLLTGEPVPGATVSLWSSGQPDLRQVWAGRTDADGIAWTPGRGALSANGTPSLARASTTLGEAWLDLSIPWRQGPIPPPDGPNAAFVFTDRPIYRPGETLRWKAFLRRSDAAGLRAPGRTAVRVTLNVSGGAITADTVTDAEGNCDGSLRLPADGRTGDFALTIGLPQAGGAVLSLGSVPVSMESFRAPRFEAQVETATPRIVSPGTGVFTGRFSYFSGGPLAGMPIRWFIRRQPWSFRPDGWDGYSFADDRPGTRWDTGWAGPQPMLDGESRLDLDGRLRLELPLALPPESGDALLTVEMGARDLADQSAFDRTQVQLVRGPWRPAVRAVYDENEPRGRGTWTWAVTDTAGKAVPGIPATLEFVRREWRTVRIRRIGGTFDYDNSPVDTVLIRQNVTSITGPDRVVVQVPGPGLYLVRITVQETDGSPLAAADSRYFAGEEQASLPRERMDWIQLQSDRRQAGPDDTVSVIIPTPPGGAHALLVVESGPLLRARCLALRGTPQVSVPLEGLAPPSVGISAVLVGPDRVPVDDRGGPRRSLPYFARGNTEIEISRDRWKAKVEVSPDRRVALPGEEVTIEVRLSDGAGAPLAGEVALAIVDEAILALVADRPADPTGALFPSRWDRIEFDDIRNQLQVLPLAEKGAETPGGGGDEGSAAAAWMRSRFEATAYWNPSVKVGPDGLARVPVRLPDSLTRYRIRAIAACAGQRFGFADAKVRVDRPLSVEAAMPRVLRPGDRWVLGAIVQNRTDRPLPVRVTCAASGASLEGSAQWKGTVEAHTVQRAEFRLRTGDPGTVKITLAAEEEGAAAPARDGMVRLLESRLEVDRITEVAFGRAAPQAVEGLRLDDPGLVGSAKLAARVSPTILAGIGDAVRYLTDFPHACTEQVDSRLLGWLARRDLADRLPPDTLSGPEIDAALASGLAALAARERPGDGGFRTWPDANERSVYLDSYTLWTLARVKRAGIDVPEGLYKHAIASARDLLARRGEPGDRPGNPSPPERAFLLWALGDADSSSVTDADLEAVAADTDRLGNAGQLCWLLALDRHAAANPSRPALRQSAAAQIRRFLELKSSAIDRAARTASLDEQTPGFFPWSSGSRDRVRPTALAVILLSRASPDHPLLPQFANWLLEERRHGHWPNTHENALAIEAVREYAGRLERLRLPMQGRIALGLAAEQGFRFDTGSLQPREFTWTLPQLQAVRRPDPRSPNLPLAIEGDGRGPLYYELRLDRFRPALTAPSAEEGLVVAREYVSADDGRRLDVLKRGQPALAHLTIVVPHDARWLAVEDPLPAGCEAVNLRLRTSSRFEHLGRPAATPAGAPVRLRPLEESPWNRPGEEEALPGAEEGRVLRFDQKDILDDRVRFYADEVPAGIYHVFYPVSATTPGTFGTPGTRASLLYEPEVYGTAAAATIRIE
jgi:alpha-2-macroglobulin